MPDPTTTGADDVTDQPLRVQLQTFPDQHRAELRTCRDRLSEQQARARPVPSAISLPGLLEHATSVERVRSGEAVTARLREELGIEAGPERCVEPREEDTTASVRRAHRQACEHR